MNLMTKLQALWAILVGGTVVVNARFTTNPHGGPVLHVKGNRGVVVNNQFGG